MFDKVVKRWNGLSELNQYRIMKLMVALVFTIIMCAMCFINIPFSEHLSLIQRVMICITSPIEIYIVMLILVNIVSFVYNKFIAGADRG